MIFCIVFFVSFCHFFYLSTIYILVPLYLSHLSFPSCFVFMTRTGKRNEIASITDSSGRKIIFTLSSVKIKTTSAMLRSIFLFQTLSFGSHIMVVRTISIFKMKEDTFHWWVNGLSSSREDFKCHVYMKCEFFFSLRFWRVKN